MSITFPDPTVLQYNGIWDAIAKQGYTVSQVNGVYVAFGPANKTQAQIDAAVQAIINGYNLLGEVQKLTKQQINATKAAHYYTLYTPSYTAQDPGIEAEFQDSFGNVVDMALDLWASINGSAKSASTAWQKVLDTRAAAKAAIASVNAATTVPQVVAIPASIVWPA